MAKYMHRKDPKAYPELSILLMVGSSSHQGDQKHQIEDFIDSK
jgi:hypothetical protein